MALTGGGFDSHAGEYGAGGSTRDAENGVRKGERGLVGPVQNRLGRKSQRTGKHHQPI